MKITGAKEGLSLMRNHPEKAFRCGPFALDRIRASANPADAFDQKIRDSHSTTNGFSLVAVCALAKDLKMNYQMAKRQPWAKVIIPSVVHWKVGHYAALIREENGRFLVQDPTFTDDLWVSQAALDAESSGFFLVPAQSLPTGWQVVEKQAGENVWGKGDTGASDVNRDKPCDQKVPTCENCGGSKGAPMAQYSFHAMLVSLNLVDTPVSYAPPRGPLIDFAVTYNQREANQPATFTYSNLGNKWTFDWLAYITDDPVNTNVAKKYYVPGGGTAVYSAYDSANNRWSTIDEDRSFLVQTSLNTYQRQLPDGSKQIFNLTDGASTYPRKVFLTQFLDPSGNSVSNTFDASFRLVAVQAIGQVTTLSYGSTNPIDNLFYKITKVTDPFGRFATFDYNGSFQLTKITDVIGVTSEFTYGAGDFITSLTTPYGTTTFNYGEAGRVRWLEAVDPMGQKERLEYQDAGITLPAEPLPAVGCSDDTRYRNSFYWDKRAIQFTNDYTKAKVLHWLHGTDINTASGTLGSEKMPLENRVYYTYPGQGNCYTVGTNGLPSLVARVLDDGTTQVRKFSYNELGRLTNSTDAAGRTMRSIYSTNAVDLLAVRVGATNELLASLTYNSQHLPITAVDASGQTNRFAFSASGQLLAITNALGQTVTMAFNTNGYLTNITGALPGATTGFTYDGTNRVRTITDSEGYTVTFDYDALDRPTKITYPDGTFEQTVYKWLDPVLHKDRRGHWNATFHDALRRVTDIQDALSRVTHFEWCSCGSLASITDPSGQTTTWTRDLQGRVMAKIYPDNTQTAYTYENALNRLKSVVDAKSQITSYAYFIDNNLKTVSYANAVIATPGVSFTCDTNYNRLLTMLDGIGTTTYAYYPITNTVLGAGRLMSVDGSLTNDTITYSYDELGRVKSRAINGVSQTAAYDALGRATIVTNVLGSFTNTYLSTTFRISTNFYPNGQSTVFTYYGSTNDFRLQQIQNLNPDSSQLSAFNYTYDADGQISTWTQQADAGTPKVLELQYDPTDQLLGSLVHSNSLTGSLLKRYLYAYDSAGNRSSEQIDMGVTKANYNNLNQLTNTIGGGPVRFSGRLNETGAVWIGASPAQMGLRGTSFVGYAQASLGTNVISIKATDSSNNSTTNKYQIVVTNGSVAKTLSFDPNGNEISVVTATSTNSYEWDAADRLAAINIGPNRSEITYDGLARRVRIVEKTNGIVRTDKRFLWCGFDLCEERDSTGASVTRRFFGAGEQITGMNYYFTRDHLGSVREMTDASGVIRARYDYDPYGRRTNVLGDLEADFGFTGMYVHGLSGLNLAVFRAYDADAGRWMRRDPIAEAGGPNVYAYLKGNPVGDVDRLGLDGSWNAQGLKVTWEMAVRQLNAANEALANAEAKLGELSRESVQSRTCPWSSDLEYDLSQASYRAELMRVIAQLRNQIPQLASGAAAAYSAWQIAAAGAIATAFGAPAEVVLLNGAGVAAAAVGWTAVGAAAGAGVVAGLVINELPNPTTGEPIGKGVQDVFTYLFFRKGW